jgi:hypothetical protein
LGDDDDESVESIMAEAKAFEKMKKIVQIFFSMRTALAR